VRKLYLRGQYFGCRHCHDLTYRSTQESDKRVYAAVRGGLDLGSFSNVRGWSVAQLWFALKVLTFERRKLDWLRGRALTSGGLRPGPRRVSPRSRP
jgi:hypothetical protein